MLLVYTGNDRKKVRNEMNRTIEKMKGHERVVISDASGPADLSAALQGAGMFGGKRSIILDGILGSELRMQVLENLERMSDSSDAFFLFEEKIDAASKRTIAKFAEKIEAFDLPKKAADNAIFSMRFALEKGDKKSLWTSLMKEYAAGKAPEAVHGFLFWAAKQMVLSARPAGKERSRKLLARLAELPHESRRQGVELDYALERFVLSEVAQAK